MLRIGEEVFDIFYPIGSYYETSNTSFNPNTNSNWFGEWVEDTAGKVLVSLDVEQTEFNSVDKTGGSKHPQKHVHTGSTGIAQTSGIRVVCGTMIDRKLNNHMGSSGNGNYFDVTNDNLGELPGGNHYHSFTTNESGEGNSGNLQPYIVVKRWHRIA